MKTRLRRLVEKIISEIHLQEAKILPFKKKDRKIQPPTTSGPLSTRKPHPLSNKLRLKLQKDVEDANFFPHPDEMMQLQIALIYGDTHAIAIARKLLNNMGYEDSDVPDVQTMLDILDSEDDNTFTNVFKQLTTDYEGKPGSEDHYLTDVSVDSERLQQAMSTDNLAETPWEDSIILTPKEVKHLDSTVWTTTLDKNSSLTQLLDTAPAVLAWWEGGSREVYDKYSQMDPDALRAAFRALGKKLGKLG